MYKHGKGVLNWGDLETTDPTPVPSRCSSQIGSSSEQPRLRPKRTFRHRTVLLSSQRHRFKPERLFSHAYSGNNRRDYITAQETLPQ